MTFVQEFSLKQIQNTTTEIILTNKAFCQQTKHSDDPENNHANQQGIRIKFLEEANKNGV